MNQSHSPSLRKDYSGSYRGIFPQPVYSPCNINSTSHMHSPIQYSNAEHCMYQKMISIKKMCYSHRNIPCIPQDHQHATDSLLKTTNQILNITKIVKLQVGQLCQVVCPGLMSFLSVPDCPRLSWSVSGCLGLSKFTIMSRSLSRQGRYRVVWLGIEVLGQLKRGMKKCHGLFFLYLKHCKNCECCPVSQLIIR